MEEHIERLSEAQRALGIEVLNVFNVGEAQADAVQVFRGRDLLHVRPAMFRNLLFYSAAILRSPQMRDTKPVVLHVHGDWSDFLFGRLLAGAIGARALVASMHGRIPRGKARLYRPALASYPTILTTGRAEQCLLEAELGRPVVHMPSAPNDAFLVAAPAAAPYRYDVIGVGNLFATKAPDLFLDCAKRRPDWRFALFGDGDLSASLLARVAEEKIDNVSLPGRRPRPEIIAALQASRMFLSTSLREGTPTTVFEAMAIGLPVVITPSNDYAWLIEEGRNGHITSGWEVEEVTRCLEDILSHEERARTMGAANRSRAAAHSWRANAELVTALMAEQIAKHPRA